jgi:hypothetical protein
MMRRILLILLCLLAASEANASIRRTLLAAAHRRNAASTNIYKSMLFSGAQYLQVTNATISDAEVTIAAWIHDGVATNQGSLFGWKEVGTLRMQAHVPYSGVIYWDPQDQPAARLSFTPAPSLFTNLTHIVFINSVAGNFTRIYTNGVQAATKAATSGTSITNNLELGRFLGVPSTSFFHRGTVEDFAVWNRALTAGEITALASSAQFNGPLAYTNSLWGYWIPGKDRLTISSGDLIPDLSGSGHPFWGTATSPSLTTAVLLPP